MIHHKDRFKNFVYMKILHDLKGLPPDHDHSISAFSKRQWTMAVVGEGRQCVLPSGETSQRSHGQHQGKISSYFPRSITEKRLTANRVSKLHNYIKNLGYLF